LESSQADLAARSDLRFLIRRGEYPGKFEMNSLVHDLVFFDLDGAFCPQMLDDPLDQSLGGGCPGGDQDRLDTLKPRVLDG